VYQKLFQIELMANFYKTGYSWFRYFSYGTYDILNQLTKQNQFSVTDVMQNVSFALNENYNVYRAKKKTELKTTIVANLRAAGQDPNTIEVDAMVNAEFDAMAVDFAKIPRNNETIVWLERYLNAFLDIQCVNHTIIARGDPCQ
jgi:hypothetical protein